MSRLTGAHAWTVTAQPDPRSRPSWQSKFAFRPSSARTPDGQKAVEAAGDTIAELLTDLDAKFPGLRARLITDDGALHRFVNVYVNDEDVRFLGALDAKLGDGDTVTILPAVAGGARRGRRRTAAPPR